MTVLRSANASGLSQDWTPAAERAREALEAAPTGQKVVALERVAAEYGIGRDLLRRAVTALRMLEKLGARGIEVPEELRRVPIGVVDIIARWAVYDREAAFGALHRYYRGELNFRELMRAEVAARPTGRSKRTPRRIDIVRAWKESCLEKIAPALHDAGLQLTDDTLNDLPVDAVARADNMQTTTQIVIVGPYDDVAMYNKVMISVLLRTLGIAYLGNPVWVVVPGHKLGQGYQGWLTAHRVAASHVRVLGLRRPPRLQDFT